MHEHKCERIGMPNFDNTLLYEFEGRSAAMCYNNLRCRLQLFQDGKLKFDFDLPLMQWDEARELGCYWILKAHVPFSEKHAA